MDFDSWIKKHSLHPDIVARLNDEYMNEIETLKQCNLDDIKELGLNSSHYDALYRAFQELHGVVVQDEFDTWASENKLKPESIQKLKEVGLGDCDKLKLTSEAQLKSLGLRNIQLVLLNKAIGSLKSQSQSSQQSHPTNKEQQTTIQETDFVKFLRGRNITDETIQTLLNHDYDSRDAFILLVEADVDTLQLTSPQQLLIKDILKELNEKDDVTETKDRNVDISSTHDQKRNQPAGVQDAEFQAWIESNPAIDSITVKKLKERQLNTIAKIIQLTDDSFKELKLGKLRTFVLKKAIGNLETSPVEAQALKERQSDSETRKLDLPSGTQSGNQHETSDTGTNEDVSTNKPLAETDFVKFLRKKNIKDATIEKLIQLDYDSFDAFCLMEVGDVQTLQLTQAQSRLLEKLINEYPNESGDGLDKTTKK